MDRRRTVIIVGAITALVVAAMVVLWPARDEPVERGAWGVLDGGASVEEVEALLLAQGVIPEYVEDVFYVSPNGDDTTGISWATAKNSLNDVMDLVDSNDVILALAGTTYIESDSKDGWVHDVDGVNVYFVGDQSQAIVTNPLNTENGGAAITVRADGVDIYGVRAIKGEITSTTSAAIVFDGAQRSRFFDSIALVGNNSTHRALVFDGGAAACGFSSDDPTRGAAFGTAGAGLRVGTAVYFGDAEKCWLSAIGVGLVDKAVVYSGDAVECSVDYKSLVQGANYGFYLESGATRCISDGRFEDVDVGIHDLSGNSTNYPRGTPVHVTQVLTGTGSVTENLFRVVGTVQINFIYGFVVESPGNMTGVSLSIENGGAPVALTKLVGAPALSNAITGTFIIKELAALEPIGIYSAATQKLIENANRSPSLPFFVVQDNDGATYIAVNYTTTDDPATGVIEWHVDWTPKQGSDGSSVFPLE